MTLSLALFRHNQSFTLVLLLVLILFLWMPTFLHPLVIEYHGMPLYEAVEWLSFHSPYLSTSLAFLLLILQGIYINLLVSRYDLIIRSSYIPSLLYIFLASILPDFRSLNPALVALTFILLACDRLLAMYKQKSIDNLIFNASFLIALASLFSFQSIVFYCIAIVSMVIFRPFSWREWMISICGLVVPYVFLITWSILANQEDIVTVSYLLTADTTSVAINSLIRNGMGCLVVFIVVMAYWKINTYLSSTTVKIKKGYSLLSWLIGICFLSFLLFHIQGNSHFIFLSIPFSIILSNYFLLSAKSFIAELLFILLLMVTTFIQINYLYPIIKY